MQEVTLYLNGYRECARGLWNNFLRVEASFDQVDSFARVCETLFGELVLRRVGKEGHTKASNSDAYPFFSVVPIADPVPIMISRPSDDGNRYWDDPIKQVGLQGVKLLLIDFFDWDQLGFIDLQYYRVKIASFEKHPHLIGREALLEIHHAKVFAEP